MDTPRRILPVIVIAQLCCTSLWFAGNAILPDILSTFYLEQGFLASLTSAVQLGFITGTLVFAILAIADRFSPSRVFFISSLLAAMLNLVILFDTHSSSLLFSRFMTGFFLAGIYPVGMKIASDYYEKGLGSALGFLVGALVVGTAFPHLLKSLSMSLSWKYVVCATSLLSVSGGLAIILFVPDGPYRKPAQKWDLTAFISGFRNKDFRTTALGYFGHMWELYTFWAFVPLMLGEYNKHFPAAMLNVPLLSFLVIALGGPACVAGGLLSRRYGAKRIATICLCSSCICCLCSPLFLFSSSAYVLVAFLVFWGLVVIADSPMFSSLIAQNAPVASRGTSLTIVNCIGFSITIASIQSLHLLSSVISPQFLYMLLALGPVPGLIALTRKPGV